MADLGFIGIGNYAMVPRNAAFVIQFDDIIDPSISPSESLATGLSANLTGFPSSLTATLANIQVRIPTLKPPTQVNPLLQNPSGHPLVASNNGTFDFGSATRDIVRAFRSGGIADLTGDPFSGFLPDREAPKIIGAQGANLAGVFQPDALDPLVFTLSTISFNSVTCAQRPVEGDVIATSMGISALVLRNSPVPGSLNSGAFNAATGCQQPESAKAQSSRSCKVPGVRIGRRSPVCAGVSNKRRERAPARQRRGEGLADQASLKRTSPQCPRLTTVAIRSAAAKPTSFAAGSSAS